MSRTANSPSVPFLAEDEEEEKPKSKGSENLDLKLLEARTILVDGPVTDRLYRAISARLLYLEHKDAQADILVVLNSPGGSADSGFGLYDLMRFVQCPIKTLCAGLCASAAVLIYLGAARGRRYSLPNSRFLLHQPFMSTGFTTASDMEITANEILRTRQKYAELIAKEIGTSTDKVVGDSNRDFWMNAEECRKYGMVDKIVVGRKDM